MGAAPEANSEVSSPWSTPSRRNECTRSRELNMSVDLSSEETVRKSVADIARCAFPSVDVSKLSVEVLTGGTTNKLFICECFPNGQKFLCRIYGKGTDQFIDRDAEVQNTRFLHMHGMGPRVHCTFRNGLLYDYVPGQTPELEMTRDPVVAHRVAKLMARLHTIPLPPNQSRKAMVESNLEHYLSLVPDATIKAAEKKLEIEFGKAIDIKREVESMREVFASIKSAIVFCHNDVTSKNLVVDKDEVRFIDYEYGSSNYQAFDIGNYFTELGGIETYDRTAYPGKEWQLQWIKVYLTEYARLKGNDPPIEQDINQLYSEINKLALSAMLLWGLWSLIQAANSSIDADFGGLALSRLGMYFFKKDEFLAL